MKKNQVIDQVARAAVLAVLPARFGSTRFPGKPLANQTGKYLIEHVVERVRQARTVGQMIVATDDQRIFDAVQSFGGQVMMTRSDHPNGTCRIAEVIENLEKTQGTRPQLVLNVQGDEPEIDPSVIDLLVETMQADTQTVMGTVASSFAAGEDPQNPNIVKVVTTTAGRTGQRAMYFSRALIPFYRDAVSEKKYLKHIGLYVYRRDFLLQYVHLPPTPLEQAEQLEQLRALEHGYPIAVVLAQVNHHGIDTPSQYEEFVKRWKSKNSLGS